MKLSQFTFLFLLHCAATSFAQQVQTNSELRLPGDQSKEALIRQIISSGNTTESPILVTQLGHDNELSFKLTGPENKASGLQIGNYNALYLDVNARSSNYLLQQDGNYNNIELTNMTTDGINFELTQRQNNNSLVLDGGRSLPSLKIEQSGGMQLTIQTNVPFFR